MSPTRKKLGPILPPLEPSAELVSAISLETGIASAVVHAWLAGKRRPHPEVRALLLESLWGPIGGWHG